MINLLKQGALVRKDKLQILWIECLEKIENEIDIFKSNEDLNNFQECIVNELYKFEMSTVDFWLTKWTSNYM